jgi:hypothetical protein
MHLANIRLFRQIQVNRNVQSKFINKQADIYVSENENVSKVGIYTKKIFQLIDNQ